MRIADFLTGDCGVYQMKKLLDGKCKHLDCEVRPRHGDDSLYDSGSCNLTLYPIHVAAGSYKTGLDIW